MAAKYSWPTVLRHPAEDQNIAVFVCTTAFVWACGVFFFTAGIVYSFIPGATLGPGATLMLALGAGIMLGLLNFFGALYFMAGFLLKLYKGALQDTLESSGEDTQPGDPSNV